MNNPTLKQHAFVLEYLATGNKVEAYRRAYDCGKMSTRTITRKAQEVAALPHVAELIAQLQAEAIAKCAVSVESTIEALASIAFTNITDALDWGGNSTSLKPPDRLTVRQRAAIKEVTLTPEGGIQVKLHDKIRALEALGKYLGMFEKKPKQQAFDKPVIIFQNMPEPKGNVPPQVHEAASPLT